MWPQEYIELKHIEDLLICGICYEFMDTSVMTSCSHSYCSLCIRKYLHYKTQCPACFTETFEKDLRKNKVLDEIITHFSQIKDKLKRFLQIQIQFAKFNETDNASNTPKLLHQIKDAHINKQENKIISNTPSLKNNASPPKNIQTDVSSPSTSGIPKVPLMFTPKSTKRLIPINLEDTKVVICPVCKVTVSEININRHLDDCLKRESMKEKPQVVESKRKPLPKLVFNLMKDVVIKKKLKEFGLSSQGDRKVLENRLQRYIVLYNAECDKSNPRPISELVKQCEDEENVEKKINKSSFLYKLQVTRNTEENIIEDERKKYLEANKDSFESLIKQIKSIDPSKKSSARRSLLKENIEENNEDIPHKRQAVAENLDDSMNYTEQKDVKSENSIIFIQDSDSDTCPLQMYSSTDPKKFLNIEVPPSSNILQSKSQTGDENNVDQETSLSSNYSSIYVNKIENDDSSDVFSDASIYDQATHSTVENSCCKDTLKSNSKNLSYTSKYKKLLQRKKKSSSKDEMKWIDSVTNNRRDLDSDSTSDQEDREDEKSKSILQDILCDISSNDSVDNKSNHEKSRSTSFGHLNSSIINSSNLEKENITSSPECSGNRSLRKRSRDSMQTDNKLMSGKKKKIKKLSHDCSTETKESECVLNDKKMKSLQNKPRLRKQLPSMTENSTIVRKSARKKNLNNSNNS